MKFFHSRLRLIALAGCLAGLIIGASLTAQQDPVIPDRPWVDPPQEKPACQQTIDSLTTELESLRAAYTEQQYSMEAYYNADTRFSAWAAHTMEELRGQVAYVLGEAIAFGKIDSLTFFLGKLGDTQFYNHYGDFEQPKKWEIAPEALGAMGKRAIPPLVKKLDSPDSVVQSQATYALMLAAQDADVTAVTQGEYPGSSESNAPATLRKAVVAWKSWYDRYRSALSSK